MSNTYRKDEMKDVSAAEFSKKLKEYAKKLKKEKIAPIPNEPVGNISKSKVAD